MKWILPTLIFIVLITSSAFSFYQYGQVRSLKDEISLIQNTLQLPSQNINNAEGRGQTTEGKNETYECNTECKNAIQNEVASAISKITITPAVTVVQQNSTSTNSVSKQISYAGLGNGSTVNTDWTTLEESVIVLDLENDYGKSATVSWEASLKVANGNGIAYARLYDETHGIAVDGSELRTENNAGFSQISSKNLPFWRGRNTYKVQIKSLNGSEVTIAGARLKVQY